MSDTYQHLPNTMMVVEFLPSLCIGCSTETNLADREISSVELSFIPGIALCRRRRAFPGWTLLQLSNKVQQRLQTFNKLSTVVDNLHSPFNFPRGRESNYHG